MSTEPDKYKIIDIKTADGKTIDPETIDWKAEYEKLVNLYIELGKKYKEDVSFWKEYCLTASKEWVKATEDY